MLRDFRRLERIISRKVNRQEENAPLKWTVTRSHDSCLPWNEEKQKTTVRSIEIDFLSIRIMKHVVVNRTSTAVRWRTRENLRKQDKFENHWSNAWSSFENYSRSNSSSSLLIRLSAIFLIGNPNPTVDWTYWRNDLSNKNRGRTIWKRIRKNVIRLFVLLMCVYTVISFSLYGLSFSSSITQGG